MGMRVGGEGAAGRDVSCGGSGGRGQPENRIPGPRVSVDLAGAVGFGKALGLLGWALCSPLPSCRISQPGNGAASPAVTRRSQCHHCHRPGVGAGLRWAQEGCGAAAGPCRAEPGIDSFPPWGEEV